VPVLALVLQVQTPGCQCRTCDCPSNAVAPWGYPFCWVCWLDGTHKTPRSTERVK